MQLNHRQNEAIAAAAAIVINPKVCDDVAPAPMGVLVGDPGPGDGAIVGTQDTSVRLALSPTGSNCDSGHTASVSVV